MPPHPNRSRQSPRANPTPAEVSAARLAAGLTQPAAAALVHSTVTAWARWEADVGEPMHRDMHPAMWELFRLKTASSSS